jgi:hypothetical protein
MRLLEKQVLFSGRATTGFSSPIFVKNFRHVVIGVATDGLDTGESIIVKIAHSYEEAQPTFSSAASITNKWAYTESFRLDDGSPITGSTGVVVTGDDEVVYVEINQNVSNWICVEVSTIDAGTVDVEAYLSDNT